MRDDLVAASAERGDQLRRLVVERRIDEHRGGQIEGIEGVAQPPRADAIAVVAPGEIEHVGLAERGRELRAEPGAELESLEIEREVDRKPLVSWPAIARAKGQGAVGVAAVGGARPGQWGSAL